VCTSTRIEVFEQELFTVDGNINHGADFILSDEAENVFVECKTKRLNLLGRIAATAEDLDAQLTILAEAVVQNYRNVKLAIDGRSQWRPNQLPSVNLVVTLEEWFLISPDSHSALIGKVRQLLMERDLSTMFDAVPFAILSAEKFEVFCCAVERNGIGTVTAPLFKKRGMPWSLSAHLDIGFEEDHRAAAQLMFDEFAKYGEQMTTRRHV
jgi:hypothetical protein